MTSESHDAADELRRITAEGRISEEALQAMTGIQSEKLRYFLGEGQPGMTGFPPGRHTLSPDESARLSVLASHLTEGLRIGDDERLKAIFESLTIECRLTLRNISLLTGLDLGDVEGAVRDPRTVPIEKKYELAVKGSYLIGAVNRARGQ